MPGFEHTHTPHAQKRAIYRRARPLSPEVAQQAVPCTGETTKRCARVRFSTRPLLYPLCEKEKLPGLKISDRPAKLT